MAELSAMEPSTGAWRSPRISSSVKNTAAMGVLNAAANAAAALMGTSARMERGLKPRRRPSVEPIPAPICTEGPSRPRARPLASVVAQQMNLPRAVRNGMMPSLRNSAALVCGIPLPRALGKCRHSR